MKFPFDEDKRLATLEKHGLDLRDFARVFDNDWAFGKKVTVAVGCVNKRGRLVQQKEIRRTISGVLDGHIIIAVIVKHGNEWRVITMFHPNDAQRRFHETAIYEGRGKRKKKRAKRKREERDKKLGKGAKNSGRNRGGRART